MLACWLKYGIFNILSNNNQQKNGFIVVKKHFLRVDVRSLERRPFKTKVLIEIIQLWHWPAICDALD